MKLYLVQHGEAENKEINPDRPLTEKGVEDINTLADFLKHRETKISNIFHSGKTRAQQTAEIFATTLNSKKVKPIKGIAPNDPVESFVSTLPGVESNTMIVGHLPFMAKLVSYLVTGKEDLYIVNYRPGSIVCMDQDEDFAWKIQWMIRPDCF